MFTRATLNEYVEKGLISVQTHPRSPDVCIYNYTQACQYSGAWDEVTTKCRGLIIDWRDGSMKLLSNPLPKFFNYEEHVQKGRELPITIPRVYEKLDGWLGILYWLDGEPYIATRGSFASTGAVWATEWFRTHVDYADFNDGWTHLFEIISPGTKIVCNYPYEGLVWLTARHIEKDVDAAASHASFSIPTLKETPPNYGGKAGDMIRRASLIPHHDYETLKKQNSKNEEGFVLVYPDGFRLKIKFEEYTRLHKIITGVSAIGIWEMLRDGQPINFENVPDEFFNWVNEVKTGLVNKYEAIEEEARDEFHDVVVALSKGGVATETEAGITVKASVTRKDAALLIQKMTNPGIGFAMLDKKPYAHVIWKMIRPHGQAVFKKDDI